MRGHIHKRERKGKNGKTTRWYVVVDVGYDEQGGRRQKWHGGYKTRRDAERALTEIVGALEKDAYISPSRLTFGEFARTTWFPQMKSQVKATTWDSYHRTLENHVMPVLGGLPLQQITAGHLDNLYRALLATGRKNGPGGLAPKTVRYVHTMIRKLLSDAFDLDLVVRNVATAAHPPKPRASGANKVNFWTPDELSRFLQSVQGEPLYPLWHLAAMTGMRRGELLGLQWTDLDFTNMRLSVRQTLVVVGYEPTFSTPKTHVARVIDIDVATLDVLRHHRKATGNGSGLVFTQGDGAWLHPGQVSQSFERAVKRSKLRRIRLHDLRHTHATMGLVAGIPVKVMSERLGHSTPAFTLQQYADVIPGMQAEAAAAIARLIRRQ